MSFFGFSSTKKSSKEEPRKPSKEVPTRRISKKKSFLSDQSDNQSGKPEGFEHHSESFPRFQTNGKQQKSGKTHIDIVFCMDCTGSMQSYINEGKKSISLIAKQVEESENSTVRFGYVAYRDHPPQDKSFITMCHNFTDKSSEMTRIAGTFNAQGGGDGPEAVTTGLKECLDFPWCDEAVKIVVLIADAPPHGIGSSGDGFPQGEPNGVDPIAVAKEMASRGIVLYVVACEPSLSNYKNAHDVMEGLAQITEGRYLPLTAASLLPAVIVGGAGEEASLKKLEDFVAKNVKEMEEQGMEEDDIEDKLENLMRDQKMQAKQVEVTDLWGGEYQRENIDCIYNASSLTEALPQFKALQQPEMLQQEQKVSCAYSSAPAGKMMKRYKKKAY